MNRFQVSTCGWLFCCWEFNFALIFINIGFADFCSSGFWFWGYWRTIQNFHTHTHTWERVFPFFELRIGRGHIVYFIIKSKRKNDELIHTSEWGITWPYLKRPERKMCSSGLMDVVLKGFHELKMKCSLSSLIDTEQCSYAHVCQNKNQIRKRNTYLNGFSELFSFQLGILFGPGCH